MCVCVWVCERVCVCMWVWFVGVVCECNGFLVMLARCRLNAAAGSAQQQQVLRYHPDHVQELQ